jgi:hypothetical protein
MTLCGLLSNLLWNNNNLNGLNRAAADKGNNVYINFSCRVLIAVLIS